MNLDSLLGKLSAASAGEPVITLGTIVAFITAGLSATNLPSAIRTPLQIFITTAGLLGIRDSVSPVTKPATQSGLGQAVDAATAKLKTTTEGR